MVCFEKVEKNIKCSFCNGEHNSRNCSIEQILAPSFKKEVGIYMEEHITQNIMCPRCDNNKLYKLGNHTPSIDLVCTECKHIYEVKSKCLSVKNLPNDIFCNGGNYNEFINNIKNKELDLIIVLYGVNREKKEIFIREILYAPNNMLKDNHNNMLKDNRDNMIKDNHNNMLKDNRDNMIKNIIISKKNDNQLSSIEIKNKEKLKKIDIKNKYLSFKELYEVLLKKLI